MKTITPTIILLSLVIPNFATINNGSNLFTKENIDNILSVFVTCTEQLPINEVAAILEDYMNTEEDIKDFMDSTINKDDFHRILTFSKTYYERFLKPIGEIITVISEKPAMQPMKEAKKIIDNIFQGVLSANLNMEKIIDLLAKYRVVEMRETINRVSKEKLMEDKDFSNLVNFMDYNVIFAACGRLQKRIQRNEALQRVMPRYLKNNLFSIVQGFYQKIIEHTSLRGLMAKHQIPSSEKLESKFLSDFIEFTSMLLLYAELDGELQGFIAYVKTDKFQSQLRIAFEKVSVGESFIRDEL